MLLCIEFIYLQKLTTMYYSETFFKKDIYNITETDILSFFENAPEESSILELKSGTDLRIEKIYEEVCALHNTQGGLILIGSPRPRKEQGREFFDGELTRSPFRNKDWVYQKISSNISPPPSGLRIHDVKMSDDKYIQIIDIPKSLHPPHQCLNNGVYYLRFETESRFAPHGLIEAMFNKRQEPTINCTLSKYNFIPETRTPIEFNISNTSNYPLLGISVLTKFYHIHGCEVSGQIYNTFDPIHSAVEPINDLLYFLHLENRSDNAVVKGIYSIHRFHITTDTEPFIVQLFIWGSNMNLIKIGFIISPINNKTMQFTVEDDLFKSASEVIDDLLLIEKDFHIIEGLKKLHTKVKKKNF